MFLSDVSIRRPVFTLMMSLALLVFGFIAYRSLPVDQFPPVDFPIMLVQTVWPGAAPEDVERDVSRKVEDAVASVPGLEKLQSISRDSVSLVVLQFEIGTDLTDTSSTVRDRVGAIQQDLPDGADAPVIRRIELGALPVMVVASGSGKLPSCLPATQPKPFRRWSKIKDFAHMLGICSLRCSLGSGS